MLDAVQGEAAAVRGRAGRGSAEDGEAGQRGHAGARGERPFSRRIGRQEA
jgi:hypothetical protein